MRAAISILLLLSLTFAGCLGEDGGADDSPDPGMDDDPTEGDDAPADPGSEEPTSTPTSGPAPNDTEDRPPTATLTASIQQGEIPFNVTFTLDGEDPDGDALQWSLDADGDDTADIEGTTLPADYTHQYDTEGLFNATFTVSDGSNTTTRNILINATAAAAAAPSFETIVITGSITGLWVPEAGYAADPNTHTFSLEAVPSKMDLLLEWGMQAIDLDFAVLTPGGSEAGAAANYNDPALGDGATQESIQVSSASHLSQTGEWTVEVYAASALEAEYTVTISFTP